jgi:hypothetical protein
MILDLVICALSKERILQRICWEVRSCIVGKGQFRLSTENLVLCRN